MKLTDAERLLVTDLVYKRCVELKEVYDNYDSIISYQVGNELLKKLNDRVRA